MGRTLPGFVGCLQVIPSDASSPWERESLNAVILCTGGLDVIRKEAWPFYRTSSGVRLCWELEKPKGPKGKSSYTQIPVFVKIY